MPEMAKKLGEEWKSLTEEEKSKYKVLAEQLKKSGYGAYLEQIVSDRVHG